MSDAEPRRLDGLGPTKLRLVSCAIAAKIAATLVNPGGPDRIIEP